MTAPTLVVVNPASCGGRTGRRWQELRGVLVSAGLHFDERLTTAPGDATALTREGLLAGFEQVVAVGGDGTLSEVVNGYFDEAGTPVAPGARVGLLPAGTGGDFRRSAGIPAGAEQASAILAAGHVRSVDVGRIEFDGDASPRVRHFLNIADCGVGGEVVARVNRGGFPPGRAGFLYHSLAALLGFRARPVRIEVDGEEMERRVQNLVVANGRWFGGGMKVAPDAALDDGRFDVVVLGDIGRARSLLEIRRLYGGTHIGRPGVEVRRAARVRVVPLGDALLFDVDGEQVGRAPATLTCLRGALPLYAPLPVA